MKNKNTGKTVTQVHHISYDPEVTTRIYKGEHWIISQITRRTLWSKGFIKSLNFLIEHNQDLAIDLDLEDVSTEL